MKTKISLLSLAVLGAMTFVSVGQVGAWWGENEAGKLLKKIGGQCFSDCKYKLDSKSEFKTCIEDTCAGQDGVDYLLKLL